MFIANFGSLRVRFVTVDAPPVLCVSKADLVEVAVSVADQGLQGIFRHLVEKGIQEVLDRGDVRSGILGSDAIGPVLHHVSAGSFIHLWVTMPPSSPEPMMEYSRRMNTVFDWYMENLEIASRSLGLTWEDNFRAAVERLDRVNPALTVRVSHVDGYYTAECDALHLVAEAATFDELTESAWALVPDLIELNNLPIDPDQVRLRFEVVQAAPHRLAL